ncbi:MAG: 5'-nucleotidase, lipoprotein e(P4) family [Flavobacteriales bacterium]|nr:5'-nucleotidase, lipoprotein e(P4) family [Flavobacteriales bacterium]
MIIFLLSSCGNVKQAADKERRSANGSETAVLWQQTSAEYTALCIQAFNIAKYRIESVAEDELAAKGKKPAVIMDLDETVLDNSPYNGYLLLNGEGYNSESWEKWVDQTSAELVPGAIEFIQLAQNKGIEVLFISNRKESELESTIANLSIQGVQIDISKVFLRAESSEKKSRREQVKSNYRIIMLVGDNLADFAEEFESPLNITQRKALVDRYRQKFGNRFIILPNVMYGGWQKALREEDSAATHQKNKSGAKKFIKGF